MVSNNVKIIDTNFAHAKFSTDYQVSKFINWDRNKNIDPNDILFITDNSLYNSENIINNNKIAMLMEPRAINSSIYDWVGVNYGKFKNILTYDKLLLDKCNNGLFYPHCGCWIKEADQKIYNKTKILSIIASDKRQTEGHRLRHSSIDVLKSKNIQIDVYGRGYQPIDYKLDSLKDYAFSLVIENSRSDYYFTEKLIDSFITGTVPIYWGCPSIGDFFNLDGIIIFNNIEDLLHKLNSLSLEKYKSMLSAVKDNFDLVNKYLIAEDWIFKNTNIFK